MAECEIEKFDITDRGHIKSDIVLYMVKGLDIAIILSLFTVLRNKIVYSEFSDWNFLYETKFSLWHFVVFAGFAVIWNRISTFAGLYHFRRPFDLEWLWNVFLGASLGSGAILLFANIIGTAHINEISVSFWLWATLITLSTRIFYSFILIFVRKMKRNLRNIVIVGSNERSLELFRWMSKPELGFNILGFIDDEFITNNFIEKKKDLLICNLDKFENYISNHPVDEVIITLPLKSKYDQIVHIIETCATQGINVRLMTSLFEDLITTVKNHYLKDHGTTCSFVSFKMDNHSRFQHNIKRSIDMAVSFFALLFLSPLFLIIALAIMLDDGLPVFFVQVRIGKNKRPFKMFKFRTMIKGAEKMQASLEKLNETDGAAFKLSDDPRVTRIGKFLRKTSLDELPQFLNVLLGTMSLVGPRPLPIRDFERFYDNTHRRRFSIKPGITGLWQISGRSDVKFQEWMNLDLQYVDNWNLFLDLKILLKTVPVVFAGTGAK